MPLFVFLLLKLHVMLLTLVLGIGGEFVQASGRQAKTVNEHRVDRSVGVQRVSEW